MGAINQVLQNRQMGHEESQLDIKAMPSLVATENARHPGLNLTYHDSSENLAAQLKQLTPGQHARAVVRLTDPERAWSSHHAAIDARCGANGQVSVVVLDPVSLGEEHIAKMMNTLLEKLEGGGIDAKHVALISVEAQKSNFGCAMFSLSFALKSHQNKEHFDKIHAELPDTQTPATPRRTSEGSAAMDSTTPSARPNARGPSERTKMRASGAALESGPSILPADFYKHTHSTTLAGKLHRAGAAERVGLQASDGRVNSADHPQAETLPQRAAAHRVNREPDMEFSASIDGFGLQEYRRALEHENRGAADPSPPGS